MPRPTPAQITYGSLTVVCSTLAMLLLSQTSSGIGVAVIAAAALGLGLLVAMTIPQPDPAASPAARVTPAARTADGRVPAQRAAAPVMAESVREPAGP
ncbi:hypothetical protein M4V62_26235 [Streptomyces durmitorensis]|uniref:Secreted protein n=1 Tax=Streptomyces durmitorensis TaxID=319947 RepID=A0ABY4Q8G3_9ACTN|nr:hypothetical protein [Streptomyces durmitorensis]UQT61690.1 hypothetical protein M4V62_26235 [Streptomyces durmitorensis]